MHRTVVAALGMTLHAALLPLLAAPAAAQAAPDTADWRRGATCYEVFVRSFDDSDGDGVGDLEGLIDRLDYINDGTPSAERDLGARCIWLMPVAASPSYHGYDVSNYYRVDPEYGTNEDFKRLVAEAHRRGIKVLVDMVLNHASSEHPYFKDALLNPRSPYRNWFRWSATDPGTKGPWGQVVWHRSPVREEWYYGIFWSGMPDLNYETPAVREEAKRIATFWLEEMGADGFRLDAIPYLVEEGRRISGSPGTHALLREYAAHIRGVAPHAFTIGEVWDSVGAMLPYYPDQLDAHFSFESSDAILETVRTGSTRKLYPSFVRLQRMVSPTRWSPFLRNHDQTRTMTYLGGDRARAKVAATLLLTLPGLPFVYYGEEIGMTGDKPDPRLRTPMHWSRGPAAGFTWGVPWEPLQPDSLTANVEALEGDTTSLLHLYRRLIHLRAAHSALGAGELVPLTTTSDAVAAYLRRDGDRVALVVANVGTTPQSGVRVSTAGAALARGRYVPRTLLGAATASPLVVGRDGRITRWLPVATLAPMQAHIFELEARR
ncbi:MAG TPA: alpha-amylase family glycosyl hydrolase [Gemmatimonadaceae bacterium]